MFEKGLNNCRFKLTEDHLYSELQEEAVILSISKGKYYGLNPVGVSIWRKLQDEASFQEIKNHILDEYDVDAQICEEEISSFLRKMTDEGLIEIVNEKAV